MLLKSVGTHPAEEQHLKFAANLRRGVLNNMCFEILNSAGDMQVADRVSTAGPREDFMTLSTVVSQQGVLEYLRAVRWPNTLFHVHTQLGLQSALHLPRCVAVADEVQVRCP